MKKKNRMSGWSGISSHPGITVWIFALASKVLDPYFMSCVEEHRWGDAFLSILSAAFGFFLFWGVSVTVLGAFENRKKFKLDRMEGAAAVTIEFLTFVAVYYFVNELLFK